MLQYPEVIKSMKANPVIASLFYALLGVLLRYQSQNFRPIDGRGGCHAPQGGIVAERSETKSTFKHLFDNPSAQKRVKVKRSKTRTSYYHNSTASFRVIIALRFDIEGNPGPKGPSPKCSACSKTVRSNQKHLVCEHCFTTRHVTCLKLNPVAKAISRQNVYTCVSCLQFC